MLQDVVLVFQSVLCLCPCLSRGIICLYPHVIGFSPFLALVYTPYLLIKEKGKERTKEENFFFFCIINENAFEVNELKLSFA